MRRTVVTVGGNVLHGEPVRVLRRHPAYVQRSGEFAAGDLADIGCQRYRVVAVRMIGPDECELTVTQSGSLLA